VMACCLCWLNPLADLLRFLVLGLRSKTSLNDADGVAYARANLGLDREGLAPY
jgi:hypothetical protein